ncbi:DUF4911 domain-containing protein [Solidesulfovibrio sp.]|uniref:DUF4911 domain-containing protein n=1 Tax=Solidesulfovibrio sp. TaxID=2910990 RepID=UPI00261CA9CE|nr:DUF4911 domain-containing protein [Solidesulfovibrio sp.]
MRRRPRRQPPYRAPQASGRLYVRLAPRNVALLKFLLEAHDNLALPTVVDRFAAVVRLLYAPEAAAAVEAFVADLAVMCPEAAVCLRPGPFPVANAFPVA